MQAENAVTRATAHLFYVPSIRMAGTTTPWERWLWHRKGKIMPNALAIFQGPQNLSSKERAISVVVGLGLAAAGTKPRPNPILNVAALIGGAYLAIRGATGRCPIKQALQSLPMGRTPAPALVPAKAPAKRYSAVRRSSPRSPAR
jgi:hypothetical protein